MLRPGLNLKLKKEAKMQKPKVEANLRTDAEAQEASKNKTCFDRNPLSWEKKMENFPKYVRGAVF